MITRLRPYPTPAALAALYATPHDHRAHEGRGGHLERVETTIALGLTIPERHRQAIGDLSCGNGEIACRIAPAGADLHLGDLAVLPAELAPGQRKYWGPLEETIHLMPEVGTFVCSETIEHLDNPGVALVMIRSKAARLLLSTPIGCFDDDNAEHLWAWDREGVEGLLLAAGWHAEAFGSVDGRQLGGPYLFGIWVCS